MDDVRGNMVSIMKEYLVSSTLYAKYLESDGTCNALDGCDFKYVRLILASFELTLWKEHFIKKDENKKVSGNFIPGIRDEFMKIIAYSDDGRWIIGDIVFDDAYMLIDVVRNKLAHGDFLIKDNDIEICVNNLVGRININKLLQFTSVVSSYFETIKMTGVNTRPIGINTVNVNEKKRHVKSCEQLKYLVDHFYYLEFSDDPIFPRVRDEQYVSLINMAYGWINEEITKSIKKFGKLPNVDKLIEVYNESLKKYGIRLSSKMIKANDIPGKKLLFDVYYKNKKDFESAPLVNQIAYINRVLLYLANEEERKLNLQLGLICNSRLVDVLEDDRSIDLNDAVLKSGLVSLPENNDMLVISMYIAMFYANYVYGLERVYTSGKREHLDNLKRETLLDFSNLDLSAFEPTVMDNVCEYVGFMDQLTSMDSAYNKAKMSLDKAQSNYDNYIKVNRNKSLAELKEVILILDEKVRDARENFKSVEKNYLECKDFMDNDFQAFKRNRAIIEHLRNSIAHGNVYLHRYDSDGSVDDALLLFKDIHDGKLKFELSIRVRDFITLFNGHNVSVMMDYLDSNLMLYDEGAKKLKMD